MRDGLTKKQKSGRIVEIANTRLWPFSSIDMSPGEFFVEHPILRRFVATTESILKEQNEVTDRLWHLRRPYGELLNDLTWLPDEFRQPNFNSAMGGGIASWLLYRSEARDLSLFSLVVPIGVATPVHNHLAWGLVGLYQGEQEEEEFDVAEDHYHHRASSHQTPIKLRARRILKQGEFYELIPPYNDVHRVRTISPVPSISLHLLANDTGCVVRQKFDPEKGDIEPFRSGWSNAPCPEEVKG
jgi:predicted metal-dependent enzyme (double-stranded beta helix superfamily)